jgi:hypothetical protein
MYVHLYVCTSICMYIYMYVHLYVCTSVCMYIYMDVHLYVYTYIYIYMIIYIHDYIYIWLYIYVFLPCKFSHPKEVSHLDLHHTLRSPKATFWSPKRSNWRSPAYDSLGAKMPWRTDLGIQATQLWIFKQWETTGKIHENCCGISMHFIYWTWRCHTYIYILCQNADVTWCM